jgi:hypothetical protein
MAIIQPSRPIASSSDLSQRFLKIISTLVLAAFSDKYAHVLAKKNGKTGCHSLR